MRSEEYLNTDLEQVRAELERDEELSDTFASIYKPREKSAWNVFFLWNNDEYVYENAYKVRTVHVGNVVMDEQTIACINRSDGRIKDYFVSKAYNVNLVEDGLPVLGRFIFSRNAGGNLVLLALAEESAVGTGLVRKSSFIEMTYVASRSLDTKRRLG
jgi:hypothetical protein